MEKKKLYGRIECDVDGILYDINTLVLEKLSRLHGLELKPSDIVNYDYMDYPEHIRQLIFSEFDIPENFSNTKYIYDNAADILTKLSSITEKLTIRTLVKNKKCQKARLELIQHIIQIADIDCHYEIIITDVKDPISCDILVEDNPFAINRKTDNLVLVRKQPYNRPCFANPNVKDLETFLQNIDMPGEPSDPIKIFMLELLSEIKLKGQESLAVNGRDYTAGEIETALRTGGPLSELFRKELLKRLTESYTTGRY